MEQAISKQSMAPLCEPIYTLRAMMANSITSIFSFLVQVIAIVLFLLLFRFVQAFLLVPS